MKKLLFPVFALALLASCKSGPNRAELKTMYVDTCTASIRNDMAQNGTAMSPETEKLTKEFCDCSGDKIVNGLTEAELEEMRTNPSTLPQEKIEQLTQPCVEEFGQKIQTQAAQ